MRLSQEVRHSLRLLERIHPWQAPTFGNAGNSGIGYESTLQLAQHGARVYIAGRSPDRVKKAIEQMKASSVQPLDLHMLEMDLQSLKSVKEAAGVFMRQESRLDILINNAGVRNVLYLQRPSSGHRLVNVTDKPRLSRSWQFPSNSRLTASKRNGKPTTLAPSCSRKRYSHSSSPPPPLANPTPVSASSTFQATRR